MTHSKAALATCLVLLLSLGVGCRKKAEERPKPKGLKPTGVTPKRPVTLPKAKPATKPKLLPATKPKAPPATKPKAPPATKPKAKPATKPAPPAAGQFNKGDIAQRRKAIRDAAARKPQDPRVIRAIIEAMTQTVSDIEPDTGPELGLPDQTADLKRAIRRRPALLGACCEALLTIGPSVYKPVVHGLQHDSRWVRYGCAWVLGRLGKKEAARPLCAVLQKKAEDMNVIVQVADSLGLLGDQRAAKSVDHALRTMPLKRAGFYALVKLLAKTDAAAASKWCCNLGEKTQPDKLRQVSAEVSGMLADGATARLLQGMLADKDTTVRIRIEAAGSLGRRKEKSAEALLLSRANDASENAGVRVRAAWALARIGNDAGQKLLQKLATSGPDFAKRQAKGYLDALTSGKPDGKPEEAEDPKKFGRRFLDLGGGVFALVE